MQAAGATSTNQGLGSIELAKPFFDGHQLAQNEREAPGHEASTRLQSSHQIQSACCMLMLSPACCLVLFCLFAHCSAHLSVCLSVASCSTATSIVTTCTLYGLPTTDCLATGVVKVKVLWHLWYTCWSVVGHLTKLVLLVLSATWPQNLLAGSK